MYDEIIVTILEVDQTKGVFAYLIKDYCYYFSIDRDSLETQKTHQKIMSVGEMCFAWCIFIFEMLIYILLIPNHPSMPP